MKKILIGMAAVVCSVSMQAQIKNVKSEVTTRITTIKDSDGEKQMVKSKETNETQAIQLKDANSSSLNKDEISSPIDVTSTTKITANGVTRMIDVDRSAYYDLDGKKYKISTDNVGYTVTFPDGQNSGVLRKTSNNNYIYKTNDQTSYGYFDKSGNLILENYDSDNDTVTVTTFTKSK